MRADRGTFEQAVFQEGLNVVLARRTIKAAKRDTANGLGKSAPLEIINFCLRSYAYWIPVAAPAGV